jgi:hypothetical protein
MTQLGLDEQMTEKQEKKQEENEELMKDKWKQKSCLTSLINFFSDFM